MPLSKRYPFALLGLFILVLSACTSDPEPSGPAGPVPSGLEDFYEQSLDWEDCEPYAETADTEFLFQQDDLECSRVTVPLDYDEPDETTIEIGVLRSPTDGTDERIGSLVMNPGGPGASGMAAAAEKADTVSDGPLGDRFDLVGFDPRGIGASEPQVHCLTDEERDARRADDIDVNGSRDEQEEQEEEFAEKCAERTEYGDEMLSHVGTGDVVKDIDVLRAVLGDEELSYLGYSYGTRIGSTYAEQFPENVRALVLDGAVDPEQDSTERLLGQAEGFGKAFDDFSEWCTSRPDCALGDDPDEATKKYQDLVRPLIDDSPEIQDGRVLSYEDATTATTQALYAEEFWEPLNNGLNGLRMGDGTSLMLLADAYNERGPDGSYATTQDANVAISCMDNPPVTDRDEIEQAQSRYYEKAPFLDPGRSPSSARDACAFWPVPNEGEPHLPDVEDIPDPLVVSTTNDPATPHDAGIDLAEALDGDLLTFEGTQHTVFLSDESECVDEAGIDYLVDGTPPPENKQC